jgi:hypothetical protein
MSADTRTPHEQALALLALAGALKSVPAEVGERFGFKVSPLSCHVYGLPLAVFEELHELGGAKTQVNHWKNGGRYLATYVGPTTDLYVTSETLPGSATEEWREAIRNAKAVTP